MSWFSGLRSRRRAPDEGFFSSGIDKRRVPQHVAIIMDGNGRWAERRGLPRLVGHRAGAASIRAVVEAAPEIGIQYLTLYTFSLENWRRPTDEVSGLMALFEEMLEKELDELHRKQVRILTIGDIKKLYPSTRATFDEAVKRTAANTGLTLVIALSYSGRQEIVAVVKELAGAVAGGRLDLEAIDEELVAEHLSTRSIPDPELIIRTSGELRLSNFLLWQTAYSEFWVTEVLWPDFRRRHLLQAVYEYQQRQRRFGGLVKKESDQ